MKYFSTFSGIGGFELGIQQAYEDKNDNGLKSEEQSKNEGLLQNRDKSSGSSSLGDGRWSSPTCIGYSEIDKYACQVYNKHFNHKNYGDITSIQWESVPDFDLFVGGFPCQAFSIAGQRKGFEDTRGTLFFDVAKALKIKQPSFAILENVKGLVSHDKGRTLETILETLQSLGYYVNIEVYNSKEYSVPQNRERIYFVCRHIKTLIKDGQEKMLNLSSPIISEYLFQILLNNLTEVQKLQETKSRDWILGYLILKEMNQSQSLLGENTKDGISTLMEESKFLSTEELWQNIDISLARASEGNSKKLNMSTTLTVINEIIEEKIYTYSTMLLTILSVIVQSRNSSRDSWKKILLNLTLIREYTKKYARINDKKEEVIVTETGNAYLTSNLQNYGKHFIVGHLRGTSRPEVFPIGTSDKGNNEEQLQGKKTSKSWGNGFNLENWRGCALPKIRRLTPKECMRLQGFPDTWCDVGADGKEISDTQKYKMAGNAVTVNVIKDIFKKIL